MLPTRRYFPLFATFLDDFNSLECGSCETDAREVRRLPIADSLPLVSDKIGSILDQTLRAATRRVFPVIIKKRKKPVVWGKARRSLLLYNATRLHSGP